MARILLSCSGVPAAAGPQAAKDITAEFAEHRPWYKRVQCTWDGSRLLLQADNENDTDGIALIDEFSDCLSAYITELFDGDIRVESVSPRASA
jgi:hypothetical protein